MLHISYIYNNTIIVRKDKINSIRIRLKKGLFIMFSYWTHFTIILTSKIRFFFLSNFYRNNVRSFDTPPYTTSVR